MDKIEEIIDYVKNHSWDYIDAVSGGIIAIILLIIIIG